MVLANWEYLYNGLTLGGATKYGILNVEGLAESPDVREDTGYVPGRHGGWSFLDRYNRRTITITGDLTDNSTFETSLTDLKTAFIAQSSALPLSFKRPNMAGSGIMRINCKPERLSIPINLSFGINYGQWVAQLVADDPFIYDDTATVTTITGATGGTSAVNNVGNFPSFFDNVRVTGPGTNFTIRINADAVNAVVINTTLTGGQYMDVNFKNRTIVKNDGTNLYGAFQQASSLWWPLPVGSTTIQAIVGSGGSGATQFAITWRPAWV